VLGKKKVILKAEDGGLISPDGLPPFRKGGVDVTLSAELDGKIINIPLGVRACIERSAFLMRFTESSSFCTGDFYTIS
jgi:hypothetical protein